MCVCSLCGMRLLSTGLCSNPMCDSGYKNSYLDIIGLSEDVLESLSYKSNLGVSLRRSIQHISKDQLAIELDSINKFYDEYDLSAYSVNYRIKSIQSALVKYDRYYPNVEILRVLNDTLGFRVVCKSYFDVLNAVYNQGSYRVVDMSQGKSIDDGYRGVHIYYKKSAKHYPIEIQVNTERDRLFNDWLHTYVYKYYTNKKIGKSLREIYDNECIKDESQFKEVLNYVLYSCKEI